MSTEFSLFETVVQVTKLACIVQLLMGEIPERTLFRQKGFRAALKPYLQLTKAVRNFNSFQQAFK